MIITKKSKLFIFIIILFLIVNTIFTTVLWFRINRQENLHGPRSRQKMGEQLFEKLGFDSTQIIKYNALVSDHFEKMDQLKEREHQAKDNFFSLINLDTVNEQEILKLAHESALINETIDTLTLNHFRRVKSICNPAQQEKLGSLFSELFLRPKGNEERERERERESVEDPREKMKAHDFEDSDKQMSPEKSIEKKHQRRPSHPPRILNENENREDRERWDDHPGDYPDGPPPPHHREEGRRHRPPPPFEQ
jgi:hypothetical protein